MEGRYRTRRLSILICFELTIVAGLLTGPFHEQFTEWRMRALAVGLTAGVKDVQFFLYGG